MTGPRSAEDRIALWLEEESGGFLPDRVLDATFDRTRGARQSGPSVWRPSSMARFIPPLIAVGAAAVIVLAAVNVVRPGPDERVGRPAAMPRPFTSPQFGYTVDLPEGWEVEPALKPWPAGQRVETDPSSIDTFRIPGSPIDASMTIGAQPAPQGTTSTTWLERWEGIREDIGGHCFGTSVGWMAATVAGYPGWRVKWRCDSPANERSNWDEWTFLAGGMGWVIGGTPAMIDQLIPTIRLPGAITSPTTAPVDTTPAQGYPSSSPGATHVPLMTLGFSSGRFGYRIRYPGHWTATAATGDWVFDTDRLDWLTPNADHFVDKGVPSDQQTPFAIWSAPLGGMTGDVWLHAYCTPPTSDPRWCAAGAADFQAITVDGHDGTFADTGDETSAFIPVGDRMYVVSVWRPGNEMLLRQILSTMTFHTPTSSSPSSS